MTKIGFSPDRTASARDLVAGLVAREDWAERELLERYTRHVERIIARITGRLDIDDQVQDVFLRVTERVSSLRDAEESAAS